MIISGGSRSNWQYFAKHLMKTEENERVHVAEIRGLLADNVRDAFREIDALASGTNVTNSFYHADINPREEERLTPQQWEQAVDTLEKNLGLEGQARFVVEHEKEGRIHRHVVWSRIDLDTLKAIPDSWDYKQHQNTSRELEKAFGLEPVNGVLGPDGQRVERRPKNQEVMRGQRSGIDPHEVTAELSALWRQADSGQAFAAALAERGYILAKGDRRDFVVVDQAGNEHSLPRRVGAKAAEIRARMKDVDRDALPSVDEGRALARNRATERRDRNEEKDDPAPMPVSHERKNPSGLRVIAEELMESAHTVLGKQTHEAPAEYSGAETRAPSAFERLAQKFKDAAHAFGGGQTTAEAAIDPLAQPYPSPSGALPAHPEPTSFDRVASQLLRDAKEAAPVVEELAVAAAAMAEHRGIEPPLPDMAQSSLEAAGQSTFTHPASELERFWEQRKESLSDGGGQPSQGMGLRWLERVFGRQPVPSTSEATATDRFFSERKDAMRANDGEPVMRDGLTLWDRTVAVITAARDGIAEWADRFQDFVGRLRPGRDTGRDDSGLER